jgi:hypothetical protein
MRKNKTSKQKNPMYFYCVFGRFSAWAVEKHHTNVFRKKAPSPVTHPMMCGVHVVPKKLSSSAVKHVYSAMPHAGLECSNIIFSHEKCHHFFIEHKETAAFIWHTPYSLTTHLYK